jgi:hypothetical protein
LDDRIAGMFVKSLRSCNGRTLLVLLSLAALNASPAMVLCVGEDGHVAVEPVGHHHCTDGTHTHGRPPAASDTSDYPHLSRDCCRPCEDSPISATAGAECVTPHASKWSLARPAIPLMLSSLPLDDAGRLLPSAALCQPPPDGASLRTIVLLV